MKKLFGLMMLTIILCGTSIYAGSGSVGSVFGGISGLLYVLFFLALLDRLDALMKLHDITACQKALIGSQRQQLECMTKLAKNMEKLIKSMDKSSESIGAMDNHLCAGITWMGENLPAMLSSEVTQNS